MCNMNPILAQLHTVFKRHKQYWSRRGFGLSTLSGIALFIVSLFVNYAAGTYAVEKASNSVTDILLGILPLVNTEIVFVEGSFAFVFFVFLLLIHEPRRIPFVLKTAALFIFIRSIFITLTHLGPFPGAITIDSDELNKVFTFGADLFFSGHTGLPFLFALMFWENYYLRLVFFICSGIAAVSVLLGHLHYSIDVFAAYFITYSIFHIAQRFFKDDYQLFKSEPASGEGGTAI